MRDYSIKHIVVFRGAPKMNDHFMVHTYDVRICISALYVVLHSDEKRFGDAAFFLSLFSSALSF